SMFCASPPPVSPCYGELSPCYGEIISVLSSCSACTANFPQAIVIKWRFLQKPVLRPPILPVFCLLSGSIRENQGAKPPLEAPSEFASPQARMEPRRLEMCECGRGAPDGARRRCAPPSSLPSSSRPPCSWRTWTE